MRRLKIFYLFIIISTYSISTAAQTNISKSNTALRQPILNALRNEVKKELKQNVSFVVHSLQMKNNFAFLKGQVKTAVGKDIDFSKTIYRDREADGMFDGDSIYALAKKVNGKWIYVIHSIGPTDVVYACWASDYKAPKALFDINENCGNQ